MASKAYRMTNWTKRRCFFVIVGTSLVLALFLLLFRSNCFKCQGFGSFGKAPTALLRLITLAIQGEMRRSRINVKRRLLRSVGNGANDESRIDVDDVERGIRTFVGFRAVDVIKLFFASSLTKRPNKLERLCHW